MLLGQLVAVSFSTALFVTALSVRPRTRSIASDRVWLILLPLLGAMVTVYRNSKVVNTEGFMPNLLLMHGLLLAPLFFSPRVTTAAETAHVAAYNIGEVVGYGMLATAASIVNKINVDAFTATPGSQPTFQTLWKTIFTHPAQSSISFDVLSTLVIICLWLLTTGSWTTLALKTSFLVIGAGAAWISRTGVNWGLVASIVPIGLLASVGFAGLALGRLRKNNEVKRKALLEKMGIIEENVVPGTEKKPPSFAPRRTVIGFWHPYWCVF